ncbi:MAG: hypothetical protein CVV44_08625 [Spirochaetae bacterium HGW-Spirochaetae-1]|jgi:methanogenic corrinoid protein MtbC1|nr:MAG: hypothetical protein CVV44_08625 [Spirochaetae bacterium HGW-Spirochaetae-1]
MKKSEYITILEKAVLDGNEAEIRDILNKKDISSAGEKNVIAALSGGIEKARLNFRNGVISIPEFLLCIDAFKAGASLVKKSVRGNRGIPVFIGVVEGDVHDLGKNIVAAVLSSSGYTVTDMGKNVTREKVRSCITGKKKAVVALSSMMSTSLAPMKDIITWLGETQPGIRIIVGGASLDHNIAKTLGAHGYADSAVTAPDELKRILATLT